MLKTLKRHYWIWKSIRRQQNEIKEYLQGCQTTRKEEFASLEKFKDIHKGERCFIVATGPSLTVEDVNKLKGEICWSMNSGIKLQDKAEFHPCYYVIGDGTVYNRCKDDFINHQLPTTFYNDKDIIWDVEGVDVHPLPVSVSLLVNVWQRNHLLKCVLRKRMSDDITKCVYMGDTVVNIIMQICFYMGFKEIYLIGTDCNYFGNVKHSSLVSYKNDDQLTDSPDAIYNGMISDYECAKIEAEKRGIKIYNATRGGMLEVFERVDLDQVLSLK